MSHKKRKGAGLGPNQSPFTKYSVNMKDAYIILMNKIKERNK